MTHWQRGNETSNSAPPSSEPELLVLCRIEEINIDVSKLDISASKSQYVCVERLDALKAIGGLLSVVKAGMHTTMLYRLPESMLDVALLWRNSELLFARGRDIENPSDSLPSWSWAGWTGSVWYEPLVEFRAKGRQEIDPSVELQDQSQNE
ncbi:hypothetical protein ACMFMG_010456 [Clarireedia jacksonii]